MRKIAGGRLFTLSERAWIALNIDGTHGWYARKNENAIVLEVIKTERFFPQALLKILTPRGVFFTEYQSVFMV